MKRTLNILIIIIPLFCNAQKQGNVWYFGDNAGLDFNSGAPIALTNGQTSTSAPDPYDIEGTSVISDSSGALLFYTNGMKIWNKNNQVMPNGNGLLGNFSSTQAALIVPQPGSSRYFYVFTTDDFFYDSLRYGFRYSIVDICLNNGLGDVISNQKNIKLLDTVSEKVTAIRHSNNIDYWVIVHKFYSDAFYAYHLSSTGITDTVISHVGSRHPVITAFQGYGGGAIGSLKASPNGQKIAIVNGNTYPSVAEYFDFDKSTGIISNSVNIQTDTVCNYYGVSFSPDNSKLYIASNLNGYNIYQYDLSAGGGNPNSVKASRTVITPHTNNYFALQLATNGKIYVTRSNPSPYLGVINFPNNFGLGCNYVDSAVYLNGKTASFGLPNFIDSYSYANTTYNCATGINEPDNKNLSIKIYPNPAQQSFTIELPQQQNFNLLVYDVTGKKVFQRTNATGTVIIDCSGFTSGIYFVQAVNEKNILSCKLIKQ